MAKMTNVLLSVSGQTGATQSGAFTTYASHGEYLDFGADITAGTATVTIEGRNSPTAQWKQLWSTAATDASPVMRLAQMRVNVTAATAATIAVNCAVPLRG